MQKIQLLLALAVVVFVCGCDQQVQTNTQKIDVLTQKMFILQQNQSQQLAAIQAQLAALPAQLDKMEQAYHAKAQEKSLFYHTNNLYLLLAIDKKIQAQFQLAAAGSEAANAQAHAYHTNETDTAFFCASQIADALATQEKRIVENVNAETRRASTTLGGDLTSQIKQSAPDKTDAARLKEMEAALREIQRDLDLLQARLGLTNPSAARP
jgi:hypothetical protein